MIWPYASGRRPARPPALIDQWLPDGAFLLEHHGIEAGVSTGHAFAAATALPLSDLPFVRLLFSLRGIPFRPEMSVLDFFSTEPFLLLSGPTDQNEIVFGIVGPFWGLHHGHMPADIPPSAEEFRAATNTGRMAAIGNLRVDPKSDALAHIWTETWVSIPGGASATLFAAYWLAIGPWSAWIRRMLLEAAARRATRPNGQ